MATTSLITREKLESDKNRIPSESIKFIISKWVKDDKLAAAVFKQVTSPTTRVCNMTWCVYDQNHYYSTFHIKSYCKLDSVYYHVLSFEKSFYGSLKDHLIMFLSYMRQQMRDIIIKYVNNKISRDELEYLSQVCDDLLMHF